MAIGGGANVAQQYLKAGLLDEFQIHVVPVLLGDGVRLFEDHLASAPGDVARARVSNRPRGSRTSDTAWSSDSISERRSRRARRRGPDRLSDRSYRTYARTMDSDRSDEQLVEALRRGDETAFRQLIDAYSASLMRVARGYVASRAVAEVSRFRAWQRARPPMRRRRWTPSASSPRTMTLAGALGVGADAWQTPEEGLLTTETRQLIVAACCRTAPVPRCEPPRDVLRRCLSRYGAFGLIPGSGAGWSSWTPCSRCGGSGSGPSNSFGGSGMSLSGSRSRAPARRRRSAL